MILADFKNAHKWLIIPLVVALIGFSRGYFFRLDEATWHQHMHGLSAILWYCMVIIQPYLITRGKVKLHRNYGALSLFLAGGVTFSALTIIPQNLKAISTLEPNPIVDSDFFYGVSFTDIITIIGFAASVLIAISKAKNLEDHAMWMISTVFWALMPAFGRMLMIPNMVFFGSAPYDFIDVLFFSTIFCVLPILIICWKLKRWHPALLLVAGANLLYLFIRPIGSNEVWRAIADELFKYS
ncbi:hypothetical protein DFQ04_2754 [Algoriphagus boseongensis]|uniref:Uncharacterized protein n=1 Tax=Algoriphagus boseongensis TaxID=1442587 RepID=A0A4R6T4B6_9BACT|nr:hypothetical protein [Algoriphagus boseongensis]TDQ16632.1 hypothetical protein DFQ04_2754 [Algoriphagus boseongensis]